LKFACMAETGASMCPTLLAMIVYRVTHQDEVRIADFVTNRVA
jgi:hypothetical protein